MPWKQVVIAVLVVASLGAAAVLAFRRPANNDNFPDGTFWICSDKKCGNEFAMTMKQLSDHHTKHFGQAVTCPKCGAEAIRAERCPQCHHIYPMKRDPVPCPKCGFKPA